LQVEKTKNHTISPPVNAGSSHCTIIRVFWNKKKPPEPASIQ
jgi:hypothetical protein